jgi:hypothetical protein
VNRILIQGCRFEEAALSRGDLSEVEWRVVKALLPIEREPGKRARAHRRIVADSADVWNAFGPSRKGLGASWVWCGLGYAFLRQKGPGSQGGRKARGSRGRMRPVRRPHAGTEPGGWLWRSVAQQQILELGIVSNVGRCAWALIMWAVLFSGPIGEDGRFSVDAGTVTRLDFEL